MIDFTFFSLGDYGSLEAIFFHIYLNVLAISIFWVLTTNLKTPTPKEYIFFWGQHLGYDLFFSDGFRTYDIAEPQIPPLMVLASAQ